MIDSYFEIIECFENSQAIAAKCQQEAEQDLREDNAFISSVMSNMGHCHDYFQCFYVAEAKGISFKKNFTEYNLINGCTYIIKPNELHQYIYQNSCEYKFYEIKFNVANPQLASMLAAMPEIISDNENGSVKSIFEEITYEYKTSEHNDDLKYIKLYELILKLNRLSLAITNTKRPNINPYLETTEVYLPLFDYINENYMNELTLKDLADVLCMQRNYFARQFKKTFSISPMRYLKYIRIEKSANLLRYTNLSIQKISELIGYDNQNSYAKAFREIYSVSPTFFRKNAKKVLLSKYK